MPRPLSIALIACHFLAFLLLLLVSLSLPILKTLFLLEVNATPVQAQPPTSIATTLRFGIWGFCATSALNQPTLFTNNGECSHPRLGYDISPALLALTGNAELVAVALKGLTVVFIVHPICALLAFIALYFVVPASRSHGYGIVSLILGIIAAILTTVVVVVDLFIVGELKQRVGPLTNGSFQVAFGNCPWMVLVSMILLWISVILASLVVCNCCGCGRKRDWDWTETYPKS